MIDYIMTCISWMLSSRVTFPDVLLCAWQLVTGWILALVFQVAHVVGEAEFPAPDESSGTSKVKGGWAALQV